MMDGYKTAEQIAKLYHKFEDTHSKELFWKRLQYDIDPTPNNAYALGECVLAQYQNHTHTQWVSHLKELQEAGKQIILYGAGAKGRGLGEIIKKQCDFWGFCDQKFEKYPQGCMDKPVVSPQWLADHKDTCYVIIATTVYYEEIYHVLLSYDFPTDHILMDFEEIQKALYRQQYFEFPELYQPHTAFVDGGCLDCETSHMFAQFCNHNYSRIFAFEPDYDNYTNCCTLAEEKHLTNFQVIQAGLSSQEGTAHFAGGMRGASRIVESIPSAEGLALYEQDATSISIPLCRLDDVVGEERIGMIKLDIEGAELDALTGAASVIQRDRPLCTISVYHRRGDVLAIMEYLAHLVPEYHFRLRHYSLSNTETVLYAFLKP